MQPQTLDGAALWLEAWRLGVRPEPKFTVSEWADGHRILSPKTSVKPGRWRTSRTPYLREIMDCLSPSHPARRVVFMKGAQIGATEAGNNWIGYVIDHTPGPMMVVFPTLDDARKESKQRLDTMLDETPVLAAKLAPARSRDSARTILVKEFLNGILMMVGANTGSGLRGRPIRFLFADDVDEYPGDVAGQGDPISLAEARTSAFNDPPYLSKVFLVSTPTVRGVSRIEREFLHSDQRRFFVPCPECGAFDWLRWSNVRWEPGRPETALLSCVACGARIEEWRRSGMLAAGEWRATAEGDGTVGFHLSGLYSPWRSLEDHVREFLRVKDDPFRFKPFVNMVWGETWEEREGGAEPETLLARAEEYGEGVEVPHGVGVLVASVDVQDDRLEVAVKGFGSGEESWLILHARLQGEPAHANVWHELDRLLTRPFVHASGRRVGIDCVAIDSNYLADQVYRFCKARASRRVFAVRGSSQRGKPGVSKPTRNNRYRTLLFTLCTDTLKERVYARLRVGTPGPGFCHLPRKDWCDEEYVAQLAAEKSIWKFPKGRAPFREWVKIRARNEALDLEVYCVAALDILGQGVIRTLPERASALSRREEARRPPPAPPRRGWAEGWK